MTVGRLLRYYVAVEPFATTESWNFSVVGVTGNSFVVGETDENGELQLSLLRPDATSRNWKVCTAHCTFIELQRIC